MNFEKIKKFGVIEEIYENNDNHNNDDNHNKDDDENHYVDESDNSGNRTGRKIIWYYIVHILSPFKNYRRIKKLIRR